MFVFHYKKVESFTLWLLHFFVLQQGRNCTENKQDSDYSVYYECPYYYCFFFRESEKSVQTFKSTLNVPQRRMRDAFWVTSMYLWVTLQVHLLSHPGLVTHSWSQLPAAHIITNMPKIQFQSIDASYASHWYTHWKWDQLLQRDKMNHRKQAVSNSTFKHRGVVF